MTTFVSLSVRRGNRQVLSDARFEIPQVPSRGWLRPTEAARPHCSSLSGSPGMTV